MQDMNPSACSSANIGEIKQLVDIRDQNTYWIAKLKDDNCWMTQNLRIINKTIDSTYSDMTSDSFTIPMSDKSGFTSSDQNSPKAYYDTEYGGYYNWYTATAGKGNASVSSGNVENSSICPKNWQLPVNGNTTTDKSYSKLLSGISAGNALIAAPYYFVYGGVVNSSSLDNAGSYGNYWSSTANSSTNAYYLNFNSSNVSPSSYYGARYLGFSVRCVAR